MIWLFAILSIIVCSCNEKMTPDEFVKTVSQDQIYVQQETVGEYIFTTHYRPSELICLAELKKGAIDFKFNKIKFEEELKHYENVYYMDFTIALSNENNVLTQGVRNQGEYAARLGELTYLLNNNFYMLQNHDTIKALNCVFSNTYGNSPKTRFIFMFPKRKVDENREFKFIYDDRTFGIDQKVTFRYTQEAFNKKLPKIIE